MKFLIHRLDPLKEKNGNFTIKELITMNDLKKLFVILFMTFLGYSTSLGNELKDMVLAQAGEPASPKPAVSGQISLNFDDADVYEVIRTIADNLQINYIVDPNVRGKVTIHTAGNLSIKDLFPIFFQILETNGLTAVKDGNIYHIVPLKDASRMPNITRFGTTYEKMSAGERIIIQIIPLKYISSDEAAKILEPFISGGGTIISHKQSNVLVAIDTSSNIQKILRLIQSLDTDFFEKVNHRFFVLEYAYADETAKILTDVFSDYAQEGKSPIKFVALPRMNTVLGVSSTPEIFAKVEELIKQIDVPGKDSAPKVFVYYVKNGDASEMADLLNAVFYQKSSEKSESSSASSEGSNKQKKVELFPSSTTGSSSPEITTQKIEPPRKETVLKEAAEPTGVSAEIIKDKIKITPDPVTNSLIIQASPKDYRVIENILNQIDILPKQVLIEVTVAEVSLDTSTSLGVEWSYIQGPGGTPSTSLIQAAIGSPGYTSFSDSAVGGGLKYMIGQANRWSAILSALAKEGNVKILSSPSVLASDNKEAKIEISDEVPVASAQYQFDTNTSLIQTNIQYRNTGVILTVTPHINENNLVTMKLKQEVSELKDVLVKVGKDEFPSFFKRTVETSLTVKDGQTIVIGGLIREKNSDNTTGLPCLINLPMFQYLFGKNTQTNEKTELIILIVPRVIANLTDVDAITEEFKSKVGPLMNENKKSK